MGRSVVGAVLATVAMYVWGFAFWGASGIPYSTWKQTPDDRGAAAALREHFPESGVYFVPGTGNPPEVRTELHDAGPTGFVIVDVDGRPEFDPGIMIRGFALNAVIVVLLIVLLRLAGPALPSYGARVGFSAAAGLFAVVLVNFGDAVWWALPWSWESMQALYNFSAVLIAGAIVARFVPEAGASG